MGIEAKRIYRNVFLKSEEWQNIRLEIMVRDDARCAVCGLRDLSNDVHHIFYEKVWKETPKECLRVLCRVCHEKVHELMTSREIKELEFTEVVRRIRKSEKVSPDVCLCCRSKDKLAQCIIDVNKDMLKKNTDEGKWLMHFCIDCFQPALREIKEHGVYNSREAREFYNYIKRRCLTSKNIKSITGLTV